MKMLLLLLVVFGSRPLFAQKSYYPADLFSSDVITITVPPSGLANFEDARFSQPGDVLEGQFYDEHGSFVQYVRFYDYILNPDGSATVSFSLSAPLYHDSETGSGYEYRPSQKTGPGSGASGKSTDDPASGPSVGGFADMTDSLGAAAGAALAKGIADALPQSKEIKLAYEAIAKMDKVIQTHHQDIEKIRLAVVDSAVHLNVVLKEGVPITQLPELKKDDLRHLAISPSTKDVSLSHYKWRSQDPQFLKKSEHIRQILVTAPKSTAIDHAFYEIGKHAILEADYQSSIYHSIEAQVFQETAAFAADVLIGLDPFTGTARSIYELFTGTNPITGADLSSTERWFAALGVFTAGYGAKSLKIYKIFEPIVKKLNPKTFKTYQNIRKYLNSTGHGFELQQGSKIRRINFKSNLNKNWGLTKRHIHKHLFDKFKPDALINIDPKGNPDLWMQNMMSLMQKPATHQRVIDGRRFLDIKGEFHKADGSGFYELGVMLTEREDGTFDLVTLLTRQPK